MLAGQRQNLFELGLLGRHRINNRRFADQFERRRDRLRVRAVNADRQVHGILHDADHPLEVLDLLRRVAAGVAVNVRRAGVGLELRLAGDESGVPVGHGLADALARRVDAFRDDDHRSGSFPILSSCPTAAGRPPGRASCGRPRSPAGCGSPLPGGPSRNWPSRRRAPWAAPSTPSSSPTIQSPGSTRRPPTVTGTLISPRPFGSPAFERISRENAGNPSARISAVSRMPPSITMPATLRWSALCVASSPQTAGPRPPASTTITSPGAALVNRLDRLGPVAGKRPHRDGRAGHLQPRHDGPYPFHAGTAMRAVGDVRGRELQQRLAQLLGAGPLEEAPSRRARANASPRRSGASPPGRRATS